MFPSKFSTIVGQVQCLMRKNCVVGILLLKKPHNFLPSFFKIYFKLEDVHILMIDVPLMHREYICMKKNKGCQNVPFLTLLC